MAASVVSLGVQSSASTDDDSDLEEELNLIRQPASEQMKQLMQTAVIQRQKSFAKVKSSIKGAVSSLLLNVATMLGEKAASGIDRLRSSLEQYREAHGELPRPPAATISSTIEQVHTVSTATASQFEKKALEWVQQQMVQAESELAAANEAARALSQAERDLTQTLSEEEARLAQQAERLCKSALMHSERSWRRFLERRQKQLDDGQHRLYRDCWNMFSSTGAAGAGAGVAEFARTEQQDEDEDCDAPMPALLPAPLGSNVAAHAGAIPGSQARGRLEVSPYKLEEFSFTAGAPFDKKKKPMARDAALAPQPQTTGRHASRGTAKPSALRSKATASQPLRTIPEVGVDEEGEDEEEDEGEVGRRAARQRRTAGGRGSAALATQAPMNGDDSEDEDEDEEWKQSQGSTPTKQRPARAKQASKPAASRGAAGKPALESLSAKPSSLKRLVTQQSQARGDSDSETAGDDSNDDDEDEDEDEDEVEDELEDPLLASMLSQSRSKQKTPRAGVASLVASSQSGQCANRGHSSSSSSFSSSSSSGGTLRRRKAPSRVAGLARPNKKTSGARGTTAAPLAVGKSSPGPKKVSFNDTVQQRTIQERVLAQGRGSGKSKAKGKGKGKGQAAAPAAGVSPGSKAKQATVSGAGTKQPSQKATESSGAPPALHAVGRKTATVAPTGAGKDETPPGARSKQQDQRGRGASAGGGTPGGLGGGPGRKTSGAAIRSISAGKPRPQLRLSLASAGPVRLSQQGGALRRKASRGGPSKLGKLTSRR